eukprot:Seg309.5 transcript_id=Seg309.5/GoldUCD/mRNA.D3Y31 product="RNA-directed DNA polymerase from mobile element jockey" protein_id=Seg309.5/GoldUCD/D3Y31
MKEVEIEGYKLERADRKAGEGGGCLLYCKESLDMVPYKVRMVDRELESIWVDITFHSQKLLVAVIYRPPKDDKFYENFQSCLQEILPKRKNILLVGDFDSNMKFTGMSENDCCKGKKMLKVLNSCGLKNLIKTETRITETSKTLIDLVITNAPDKVIKSGVFNTGIADHSLVYVVLKLRRKRIPPRLKIVTNNKKCDWKGFEEQMDLVPWSVCSVFDDINDCLWAWDKLYSDVKNEFIKERKAKIRSNSLSWITTDIRKEINKRYNLLNKAQSSKLPSDWQAYKKARNHVTSLLRMAEMKYWEKELEEAYGNSKNFWSVVKKMTGKNKINNKIGPIENDEKVLEYEDKEKATAFNSYFSKVGEKLAETFTEKKELDNSYIDRVTPTLTTINDIESRLDKAIDKLKFGKATGVDKITVKEIKSAGRAFSDGFMAICIKSIKDKQVPTRFKIAKLKMTYKSGGKIDRANYRPLSMLSIPSKILEGIVCSSIDDHRSQIPNPSQWGYEKGLSTELLLVHLTETWKVAIDKGKFVGVLLIDFRKAFDTVDHSIIPFKLQSTGISGSIFDWVNDYLSNRMQFCEINEATSNLQPISYGVPQGSLLGPRIFSIYVKDFPECLTVGKMEMYADDTTAYCVEDSVEKLHTSMMTMIMEINNWRLKHRLTIHFGKTKALILNRHKFIGPLNEPKINNQTIDHSSQVDCLGVTLDPKLSWAPQISEVSKSFNAKVKKLKSMRYLRRNFLEDIYFKTIIPAISYNMLTWGTCSETLFDTVEKIRARAARIVYNITGAHTNEDVLKIANWEPISYMYKRKLAVLMQNVHLENTPRKISQLFTKHKEQRYNLRKTTKFCVPSFRTDVARRTIAYRGAALTATWANTSEGLMVVQVRD